MRFPEELTDIVIEEPEETAVTNGEASGVNGHENSEQTTLQRKQSQASYNKQLSINDVISHMVVLTPVSKEAINGKLKNCINVLKDDLEAIERVAKEISEDASDNGVRYFEVGLNPIKFISAGAGAGEDESLSPSAVVRAVLRGLAAAEPVTGARGGVVVQVERGGTAQFPGVVQLCEQLREEGVVGLELCSDTTPTSVLATEAGQLESLLFSTEDIALMAEARERKVGIDSLRVSAHNFGRVILSI